MSQIHQKDVLQVVSRIADEENLKVSMKYSMKGGAIAGFTTLIGGLLAGPIGLAIGGTVGGVTAAVLYQDKFKPVAQILTEMDEKHRKALVKDITKIIEGVGVTDIITLMAFLSTNLDMRQKIISAVISYLTDMLKMEVLEYHPQND